MRIKNYLMIMYLNKIFDLKNFRDTLKVHFNQNLFKLLNTKNSLFKGFFMHIIFCF